MTEPRQAILPARAVLAVTGADARPFLQGLITNDIAKVGPGRAIYAALLTPQGKFLHDFFVGALGEALVLDCEAARRDDLERRLLLYRLRAAVTITRRDDLAVAVAFGGDAVARLGLEAEPGRARALDGGLVYVDPRLAAAGVRAMAPRDAVAALLTAASFAEATPEDYDRHRLVLGLPDGSRDIAVERGFLLESNLDALAGVDFDKGCYVGQELTARTRYRANLRKRLVPVAVRGPMPPPGAPVMQAGRPVGELRSGRDGRALALLRLDAVTASGEALVAGEADIVPELPEWLILTHPSP